MTHPPLDMSSSAASNMASAAGDQGDVSGGHNEGVRSEDRALKAAEQAILRGW